ncbi:LysR family transcriptional regulator [Brevibacterium sp. FAM 25378]|uniref:LysR family transcriptional regulator n=1 Tax=unclassified Brevibacterium TaxID=2614124 RepID=UPI001091F538|nr:LysR family transcriptional regulator [Brevibacterium sp. S22]TGD27621.1 LysR family transcriptional regulator [Brevibacterium sp. S22]
MNLLSSLKYFVAVAEHASFTRAADYLGVAQPPVSRRIAELEKHLRVRLFDRRRRDIGLTTAGENLLAEAIEILRRVENLPNVARPRTEDYFVGVVGSLDPATLAKVGDDLRIADIHVRLVPDSMASLDDRIAAGELDAGLIVGKLGESMSRFSSMVATDLFVELGVASKRYARQNDPSSAVGSNASSEMSSMSRRIDIGDLRGMPAGMDLSRIASLSEREKIVVLPEDAGLLDDSRLLTPLVKKGIHLRQLEVAVSEFQAVAHVYSHDSVLLCTELQARKNSLPFRRLSPPAFAKRVYTISSNRLDLLAEINAHPVFKRALAAVLGATTNLQHQPDGQTESDHTDERLHPAK